MATFVTGLAPPSTRGANAVVAGIDAPFKF